MSSDNFDLYSAYYDLLYANKKYGEEAEFIAVLLREYGRDGGQGVLELGCGTGIHAAHFAGMGLTVHGIDRSSEMLKAAEVRAAGLPDDVSKRLSFAPGDLCDFKVDCQFDHVVSLFDVFSYLPDNASFRQMLDNVKAALRPGGMLVFDCWYGPAVYSQQPHMRVRRLKSDKAKIVRIAEPVFHHSRNVVDVNYDIFAINLETGVIGNFQEVHPMRCFFDAELDELMAGAGFDRQFAIEWFSGKRPSTDSWSVLFGFRLTERADQ